MTNQKKTMKKTLFQEDDKIPKDLLFHAIHKKYATLEDLAKIMGGTKQSMSDAIKRQSPKFLRRLREDAGIDLSTINSGNTNTQTIGDITNTNSGGTNELLIKNLLEQIEELKRERDSLRDQCLELTEQLNLRGRDGSNKSPKNRERDYNKRKQL